MSIDLLRRQPFPSEYHLLLFTGLNAAAAGGYLLYSPEPVLWDLLVVLVPLGVSLGLGLFTLRLRRRQLETDQVNRIVKWGWVGTVAAAAIAGWMIALHHVNSAPIGGVVDQTLILISVGIGAGVFVGRTRARTHPAPSPSRRRSAGGRRPVPDRDRVLAENSWVTQPGDDPILETVVQTLADADGVDPLELEPIHTHIDPDLFARLLQQEDSEWQLLFYTDEYAVQISSVGTVTVYEREL